MKKNAKVKSKAGKKYTAEVRKNQQINAVKKKGQSKNMKYSDIAEQMKHIPNNVVSQADVHLKIGRDDLITLLSELMNNVHESENGISIIPLKMNVVNSKEIPINQRITLSIDKKLWNAM